METLNLKNHCLCHKRTMSSTSFFSQAIEFNLQSALGDFV